MSKLKPTLGREYFEAIYATDPDPWKFATSDYERRKYAVTISALPLARYTSGLEVGCSIGVLTKMLGARCDSVLGVDVAASAIGQARQRCTMLTNVRFAQLAAPGQWPPGLFDLMVLSEILYYFDPRGVSRLAQRVRSSLLSEGDIALVHWTGPTNYPLSGDGAVELFIGQTRDFALVVRNARYEKFRLDILRRRGDF